MILDFPAKKVHISANHAIGEAFQYDMSGLEIVVPTADEPRYIIEGVRVPSEAASAGIRPGDEIITINGSASDRLSLDEIYQSLLGREGKKIRLELMREGKKIRVNFRLEKYI
jgi:C-terminal processing protease CtpA/Prc